MLSGHYYKILNFNQMTKQMLFFTERKRKQMRLQGKVSDDKYTEAKKKKKNILGRSGLYRIHYSMTERLKSLNISSTYIYIYIKK